MNIEEEFLKFSTQNSVFPHSKNYVANYIDFKETFDKEIHPEIKTKILEIEKSGYYNDHGVDHIKMVISRVSWLLELTSPNFHNSDTKSFISPYELFILLMAIQLHDAGHLIASRADHAKKGKELLAKFDGSNKLSTAEKQIIGDIARAHGGKDDPIGKLEPITSISHQKIRPQFLAALLRLGDELAEDETRASNFLLSLDQIEPTSKIFHLYSASLSSIELSDKEICLKFFITDKHLTETYPKQSKKDLEQKYLVEEVYLRTQKTFLEALYCSRFLPEQCRFNKVRVKITLLSTIDHDELTTPIGYELKEKGYPTMENSDIYTVCETLTLTNGQKINGEYISNLIKLKLLENEKSI